MQSAHSPISVSQWVKNWANSSAFNLVYRATVESTQKIAKDYQGELNPCLFLTDHQTQGRGRNSNTWLNHPGESFLGSFRFLNSTPPAPITTVRTGLALYQCLQEQFPQAQLSLKAPNDLYLGDKKLAGLLLEVIQMGNESTIILGLGINVFSSAWEQGAHLNQLQINEITFAKFLKSFTDRLLKVFNQSSNELLDSEVQDLTLALKLNQLHHKNLIAVTASADLVYPDRTVSWLSL